MDPSFQAFMRAQGVEESEIVGEVARRTSAATRGLARRDPVYEERTVEQGEEIAEDFESRGMFRSGMRLQGQARSARGIMRSRLEDHAGVRDGIADSEQAAARSIAGLRRGAAEADLDARQRVSIDAAEAGIR